MNRLQDWMTRNLEPEYAALVLLVAVFIIAIITGLVLGAVLQ